MQNPVFEKVPITRAVPVPTPYVKRVPIIRKIPVPVPNKKSVPDTKLVNETNVKIVGYQKTQAAEEKKDEEECSDEEKADFMQKKQKDDYSFMDANKIQRVKMASQGG